MRAEAFLCDAATVREGLLHVLGAGVTRMTRTGLPAPLEVQLAMMLTLMPVEARGRHQLKVVIQNEDGIEVAAIDAQFGVGPGKAVEPGEPIALPLVLNLRQIAVPAAGVYSVEILVDSQLAKSLPFKVVLAPPPAKVVP